MKVNNQTFRLEDAGGIGKLSLIIGILGAISCVAGFFLLPLNREQFFYSYLTSFVFWAALGLGALFFTLLHHLVDATWSVVLRRITESVMATLPLMIILFIPIAFGLHDLYHWSHLDAVAKDPLLQLKSPYLNSSFFLIRTGGYFLIWTLLARALYKTSLRQDEKHSDQVTIRFRRISGPGMLLFALTITFAAFDWLMSLDPHWYSTIFGVYFFAGSLLSILAFITLVVVHLRRSGVLATQITIEHFHDLGKLLFAFTIFWSYIAFSQYFLIWYANIPEETIWFIHRWEGNWKYVSLALVFGHFVFPFLILLSRVPKRNVKAMTIMSIWVLVFQWVDLFWIIIPNFQHHFHFSFIDFVLFAGSFLGIGGIFVASFWKKLSSHPIVPVNDPNLEASMKFVNI